MRGFFTTQTQPGTAHFDNHRGTASRHPHARSGNQAELPQAGAQTGIRVKCYHFPFFTRFAFGQREVNDVQPISHYDFPQNPVAANRRFLLPKDRQRIVLECLNMPQKIKSSGPFPCPCETHNFHRAGSGIRRHRKADSVQPNHIPAENKPSLR